MAKIPFEKLFDVVDSLNTQVNKHKNPQCTPNTKILQTDAVIHIVHFAPKSKP